MSNWMEETEKDAQKASGGGIIAQMELQAGYKLFVTGLGNRDSFFPFTPGNDESKKKAFTLAKAKGEPKDVRQLVVYKNSVKGREVNWKDDRFFSYELWTPAFKEIFFPSVKEHKELALGQKFWGKVSFKAEPKGRMKPDQNGEMKPELIAYIAQVYASEQEDIADAGHSNGGSNGSSPADPMVPDDYKSADWYELKAEFQKAITEAEGMAKNPVAKKKARAA